MTERAKFHSAVQQPGQSIREYSLALQKQAAKCSFGMAFEIQLRDRLVAGIADRKLQAKLLIETDLMYAKAKQMCERHADVLMATTKTENCLWTRAPCESTKAGKCTSRSSVPKVNTNFRAANTKIPVQRTQAQKKYRSCMLCGGNHLHHDCKLRKATCYQCGRQGHISACANRSKRHCSVTRRSSRKIASQKPSQLWQLITIVLNTLLTILH